MTAKHHISAILFALGLSIPAMAATNELTLDNVEKVMSQGPRLVVMWSLECPACFDEIELISQMLREQPSLAISFISTDDDPSRIDEINEVYASPALSNTPRWVYAPRQGAQLRYKIDPSWQGELPRSYFIDQAGKRHGHSGLLTAKQLAMIVARIE